MGWKQVFDNNAHSEGIADVCRHRRIHRLLHVVLQNVSLHIRSLIGKIERAFASMTRTADLSKTVAKSNRLFLVSVLCKEKNEKKTCKSKLFFLTCKSKLLFLPLATLFPLSSLSSLLLSSSSVLQNHTWEHCQALNKKKVKPSVFFPPPPSCSTFLPSLSFH